MTTTLLLIAGLLAFTAVFVTIVRTYESQSHTLASEATAVGLGNAGTDTLVGHNGNTPMNRIEWRMTTVSALCDAEDLLDSLEAQGIAERELLVLGNSCFAVRWR